MKIFRVKSEALLITCSFYCRKETEVPFLRKIVRLRNQLKSSHPPEASGHSSAMSFLFANVHAQQHRASTHCAWTQERTQLEGVSTATESATGAQSQSLRELLHAFARVLLRHSERIFVRQNSSLTENFLVKF